MAFRILPKTKNLDSRLRGNDGSDAFSLRLLFEHLL